MTGTGEPNRAIEACRAAGLPVIDETDCTCRLRGRLVVVARSGGLQIVWPYDRRCPAHGRGDREGPWPRQRRSRSQATRAWAMPKAGAR
jgi:hypothetical protein